MATQTETQRKAAAQKAAATRRRNAAARSRSAKKAAETRALAQKNVLQRAGLQAERAADIAIGATVTARDNVVDAVKPLGDPRAELKRLRGELDLSVRRFERRGSQARKRATRAVRRRRNDVERQAGSARRDVEKGVRDARSTTEDFVRRVEGQARSAV